MAKFLGRYAVVFPMSRPIGTSVGTASMALAEVYRKSFF